MTEASGKSHLEPSDYNNQVGRPARNPSDRHMATSGDSHPGTYTSLLSVLHERLPVAALFVVPVLGTILCLIATRHGVAIGQDSAAYMGAADNLIHGRGITTPFDLSGSTLSPNQVFAVYGSVPLVHFPPLYPVTLAAVSSTGLSIVSSARWLNAILMGANLFVFQLLVRRFSTSNLLVPVAAALLLLAGPAVFFHQNLLLIAEGAWSEPLFLFVFLLGVLFVEKFLDQPTGGSFFGIAVCVALVPLIRYVGFSMIAGAAIVMLLWAPLTRGRRWKAASMLVLCGVAPSVAWSFYTSSVLHGGSARQFAWHAPSEPIHWLLYIGSGWILPGSIPDRIREALFLAVLLAAGLLLLKNRSHGKQRSDERGHVAVLLTFAATYLAVLLFTLAFLDDTTPAGQPHSVPADPFALLVAHQGGSRRSPST
jgi:hypothetical protein